MRADLQELEITLGELKRLTNCNFKQKISKNQTQIVPKLNFFKRLIRWLFRIFGVIATIVGLFGFIYALLFFLGVIYTSVDSDSWTALFVGIIGTIIGIFLLKLSIKILREKSSEFIDEVNKHNQIISNIDILAQLEAVGNPVKLNERKKVIQALIINRGNITRALETERILRENPQFRPEQFNIDLSGLRALEASEKATEYGRFLDEALQIGVSVQTEMRKLENKRLGL